ncbi:MAG: hypothetical protein Q4F95_10985 [Oscillospiraceae bacterium]|nr:hypothetical protein [Oscillospiraceae bacterium]
MKKLILLIVSFTFLCSLSSCSKKSSDSSASLSGQDYQTTPGSVTQTETSATKPVEEVDAATADERAKKIYEAAQQIAERYETAGATLNSEIMTSDDIASGSAEKLNFISQMQQLIDFDGKWAFSMRGFKIQSAVYCVSPDTDVLGRFPESFSGELTDGRTGEDLSSYLD